LVTLSKCPDDSIKRGTRIGTGGGGGGGGGRVIATGRFLPVFIRRDRGSIVTGAVVGLSFSLRFNEKILPRSVADVGGRFLTLNIILNI